MPVEVIQIPFCGVIIVKRVRLMHNSDPLDEMSRVEFRRGFDGAGFCS